MLDLALFVIWFAAWLALAAVAVGVWRHGRVRIHHLWWMPKDGQRGRGWKPRHAGRPALVAATVHEGATVDWSPEEEFTRAEAAREPEETEAEAAEREAQELARHRADQERAAEEEVVAEFDAAWTKTTDGERSIVELIAAVDDACRTVLAELGLDDDAAARLLAKHEVGAEPTGEYPTVVLEAVSVA